MAMRMVIRVQPPSRNPRMLAEIARGFIRGVVACNRLEMRLAKSRGRPFPSLYDSGIRYEREPWRARYDEFTDAATLLARGWGDCEDLSAYRIAELQESGELGADVHIYWRSLKPKSQTMHVEVRRANGEIEDPSRLLGL